MQDYVSVNLKLHAEVHNFSEEWSGKTDPRERRKLQNRLNQRAYRRRKASTKPFQDQFVEHELADDYPINIELCQHDQNAVHTLPAPETQLTRTGDSYPGTWRMSNPQQSTFRHEWGPSAPSRPLADSWCRDLERSLAQAGLEEQIESVSSSSSDDESDMMTSSIVYFEEEYLRRLEPQSNMHHLLADHLLSLMYYNVFRALVRNVQLLGLDMDLMHGEVYPSPWTENNVNKIGDLSQVPPQMHPTKIQRTIPHHPCFDLPPDPALRDNGIVNSDRLPHGKLCLTLAGRETWYENDLLRRNGLVVWGEPDKVESWEATEGFVKTFPWLLVDASALQESTNRWRAMRGEQPLEFA